MKTNLEQLIRNKSIFPLVEKSDVKGYELFLSKEQQNLIKTACPLSEEDIEVLQEKGYTFPCELIPHNTVLIRNPFRPYEFVSHNADFYKLMNNHLGDIASLYGTLGAISCDETARIVSEEKIIIKGKGKIKTTINIAGRIRYTMKEVKDQFIHLHIESEPKSSSYEERYQSALDWVTKYKLNEVEAIKDILRRMDPILKPTDKKHVYEENLTETLYKEYVGALKIQKSGIFKMSGDLSITKESFKHLYIKKEIKFNL